MSVSDQVEEMFEKLRKETTNYLLEYTSMIERKFTFLDCVDKDIEQFKKDGTLRPSFQTDKSKEPPSESNLASSPKETTTLRSSSIKENSIGPQVTQTKRQTRRNGLRATTTVSNTTPSTAENQEVAIPRIKIERATVVFEKPKKKADIEIKQEQIDMPPPVKPALKNKRTRKQKDEQIKVKAEVLDTSVIEVQKAPIDVIVLEDSFDTPQKRVTRARTKVRMKASEIDNNGKNIDNDNSKPEKTRTKRKRVQNVDSEEDSHKSGSDENKTKIKQPSKKKSNIENENINRSTNKDIQQENNSQTHENRGNRTTKTNSIERKKSNPLLTSTPIVPIPKPNLNETVVIEKAMAKQPTTIDDLMTEDEDVIDESPVRKTRQGKPKQIFSPYENSPVKKRVQAFEKLGATVSDVAITATRSRTKLNVDVRNESGNSSTSSSTHIPRFFGTPLKDTKFKTLQTTSTSKKTGSALKASQMEFRERELRRKQKEAEALQKKEALICAQTEEKRRKREERELKVQQTKLAMEKEKQKQLELRQALAEKEAKFLKQKEEAAKKRAAVMKKGPVVKLQEEFPAYLKYDPPLLPTHDCYDSDDESASNSTLPAPEWQKSNHLERALRCMLSLKSYKKGLFSNGQEAPNLKVIFPMIEPGKLKRTSSAIWNETEMSILESMIEE